MDRAAILETLRAHRAELERAGIAHAALFGSHARGTLGRGAIELARPTA